MRPSHMPELSARGASGSAFASHSLKLPMTDTRPAFGAHTRKLAPSAPLTGLGSGAAAAARGLELPCDGLALIVYPQPALEQGDRLLRLSGQP